MAASPALAASGRDEGAVASEPRQPLSRPAHPAVPKAAESPRLTAWRRERTSSVASPCAVRVRHSGGRPPPGLRILWCKGGGCARVWYAFPITLVEALYQPFPMAGAARGQIWRYSPQYRRPRHFHAEPELNLVTAGTGTFGAGASVFSATAGELLWWLPGEDHELLEASPDFDLFVVGMSPRALRAGPRGRCGSVRRGRAARARLPASAVDRLRVLLRGVPR